MPSNVQPSSVGVQPARRGFTLIEVLVVVAIIALLISILLPSLSAARNVARLAVDKSNTKQIATMNAQYQAEYNSYVPLLSNFWDNGSFPAEQCWLSVALRNYSATTRGHLARGTIFDPTTYWGTDTRDQYEKKYMPACYICPFEEVDAPQQHEKNWHAVGNQLWDEDKGRWEAYCTWLHTASDGFGYIVKGSRLNSKADDPVVWRSKYTTITFNWNGKHRKWDLPRRKSISNIPAEWTAMYCGQGEFTPWPVDDGSPTRRKNVGSHKVNGHGGTNVMFADTHVEWVRGTELGKP